MDRRGGERRGEETGTEEKERKGNTGKWKERENRRGEGSVSKGGMKMRGNERGKGIKEKRAKKGRGEEGRGRDETTGKEERREDLSILSILLQASIFWLRSDSVSIASLTHTHK